MSSGPVRRVSHQDIQLVQNLIERCLQLYMNQKEVVDTLLAQAKIEPGFTELVWQKLEEENRDFFKAYYLRLMVKHQIMEFNRLLEQQVRLMQIHQTGVASIPASNGSHIAQLHQNYGPEHTGPSLKPENMHHPVSSSIPNVFTNGGSPLHTSLQTAVDISACAGQIDTPSNMLSAQRTNLGLMQGMNGGLIKSEAGYSGTSSYMFGATGNVLEARSSIGDAAVASFSSVESNSQPLNETLLDADTSQCGFLAQISRNFSFSDLSAEFSHSSDILENYPRSPFLAADEETFLDSHEREHQGDKRRLDTISEGLSYDDFGSD
ncbi:A_thal_3526 domain-containing protein [Cephalotus follicularis]|uniref:A_thal_3526 domain-containing protein n=1 Tax=Cephalotus follicularis TaxID=3775 RepID=A0A1Q3CCK0_CEPFO|nr:A_thal_3526 domain-containing protein [Cephalotus follicularis]